MVLLEVKKKNPKIMLEAQQPIVILSVLLNFPVHHLINLFGLQFSDALKEYDETNNVSENTSNSGSGYEVSRRATRCSLVIPR